MRINQRERFAEDCQHVKPNAFRTPQMITRTRALNNNSGTDSSSLATFRKQCHKIKDAYVEARGEKSEKNNHALYKINQKCFLGHLG